MFFYRFALLKPLLDTVPLSSPTMPPGHVIPVKIAWRLCLRLGVTMATALNMLNDIATCDDNGQQKTCNGTQRRNGAIVYRHSCCAVVHWLTVVIYCLYRGSNSVRSTD